jgi:hypothetical protein
MGGLNVAETLRKTSCLQKSAYPGWRIDFVSVSVFFFGGVLSVMQGTLHAKGGRFECPHDSVQNLESIALPWNSSDVPHTLCGSLDTLFSGGVADDILQTKREGDLNVQRLFVKHNAHN